MLVRLKREKLFKSLLESHTEEVTTSAVIVGIDPGTTTGLAFFDLEGTFLCTESRRNFKRSEIRKFILEQGKPIIIASDMNPLPQSIEKIASCFSARVIFPEGVLTRKDKRRIVGDFLKEWDESGNAVPWKNQHEKDALVAGWYAWKRVRRTVFKIEKRFGRGGKDRILESVLRGKNILRENKI